MQITTVGLDLAKRVFLILSPCSGWSSAISAVASGDLCRKRQREHAGSKRMPRVVVAAGGTKIGQRSGRRSNFCFLG